MPRPPLPLPKVKGTFYIKVGQGHREASFIKVGNQQKPHKSNGYQNMDLHTYIPLYGRQKRN